MASFDFLRFSFQNPICLKAMKEKLDYRLYSDFTDLEKDFCLLMTNCYVYNGLKSGDFLKLLFPYIRFFFQLKKLFSGTTLLSCFNVMAD